MPLFLQAFLFGIAVAAPLGPVGAAVMRTGLLRGFPAALAIGLGAAVVDGAYFAAAAEGADRAFRTAWLGVPLWLGGTALLCYLAAMGLVAGRGTAGGRAGAPGSLGVAFGQGLLMTSLNPLTIASWLAIAGSLAVSRNDVRTLLAATAFIVAGSACWFAVLSTLVARGRHVVSSGVLRWATVAASLLIFAFAARFLVQGLDEYVLASTWLQPVRLALAGELLVIW